MKLMKDKKVENPEHTEMPGDQISDLDAGNPSTVKPKERWFSYKGFSGESITEMRGVLMILATVIMTMSFAPSISPPGGLWQTDVTEGEGCRQHTCITGQSVAASYDRTKYVAFFFFNTISFTSAVAVIFVLIFEIFLHNQFFIIVLAACICINLISISLAYISAVYQITPQHLLNEGYSFIIGPVYINVWIMFLMVMYQVFCLIGNILLWIKRKLNV